MQLTSQWLQPDNLKSIHSILESGEVDVVGQVAWGSNYTFLVQLEAEVGQVHAIYKPERGERPLWDFPYGSLSDREVAAYTLSQALGWSLVPPTVKRSEGPAGPGSFQLFVEADPEIHYFTLSDDQKQRLRPAALFDILINNADRKSGHILIDDTDHLWLIDHGVCFHEEYKLRTVVWDFVGETIPAEHLEAIETLVASLDPGTDLYRQFCLSLSESEIKAMRARAAHLLSEPTFPAPGPGRPYPWPLV